MINTYTIPDYEEEDFDGHFDSFRPRRRYPINRNRLVRFSTKRPTRTLHIRKRLKKRPTRVIKAGRPRPKSTIRTKKRPPVAKPTLIKVVKKPLKVVKKPIPTKQIKQAIKDLKKTQSKPNIEVGKSRSKMSTVVKIIMITGVLSGAGFGIYKFIKHKKKTNGHTRKSK